MNKSHDNRTARGRFRALVVGVFAVAMGALGFSVPAMAADLDAITNVTVTWPGDPVLVGTSVRVDATWAVPSTARGGDTFSLTLPTSPKFDANAIAPFAMKSVSGDVIGTCTVTPTKISCVLSDVVNSLSEVHGSLYFWATAKAESGDSRLEFTTSVGTTYTAEIPGSGGVGPEGPGGKIWPTSPFKDGWIRIDNGKAGWAFYVTDTMVRNPDGTAVVFTDTFSEGLSLDLDSVRVYSASKSQWTGNNPFGSGTYLPASSFHVITGGALAANQFQIWIEPSSVKPDFIYSIKYDTSFPVDAENGEVYTNTINVPGFSAKSDSVTYQGAGGSGDGIASRSIEVTKAVAGPAPVDQTFEFSVDCVLGNGSIAGFPVLVQVRVDIPGIVPGVPVGSTCTVTETDMGGADGVVFSPEGPYLVTADSPLVIPVLATNTFRTTGALRVLKAVDGDGVGVVPAATPFEVKFSYTGFNGDLVEGTWDLRNGASGTLANITTGTVVTLTESAGPVFNGMHWEAPEFLIDGVPVGDHVDVTIGDGTTVQVGLTNTALRNRGGIEVTKTVAGDGADAVPAATQFTVNYSYNDEQGGPVTGSWNLANGETAGLDNLAEGTVVTLSEAAAPAIAGVQWQTGQFSVNGGTPSSSIDVVAGNDTLVEVSLVNTAVLLRGDLQIMKNVQGAGASVVPGDTAFTVNYSYLDEADVPVTGTWELTSGQTETLSGLAMGTEVTLTEAPAPDVLNVAWQEPAFTVDGVAVGTSATVVVGSGSTVVVDLTNTADLSIGGVSLIKTVAGDAGSTVPSDTTYPVTYSYTDVDGENVIGTTSVRAGVETYLEFPEGAVVTFVEGTPRAFRGMTWQEPVFTVDHKAVGAAATVPISADGVEVEMSLTNTASATSEETPTPAPTPTGPAPAPTPSAAAGPGLAVTGAVVAGAVIVAVLLTAAGIVLVVVRRRRNG